MTHLCSNAKLSARPIGSKVTLEKCTLTPSLLCSELHTQSAFASNCIADFFFFLSHSDVPLSRRYLYSIPRRVGRWVLRSLVAHKWGFSKFQSMNVLLHSSHYKAVDSSGYCCIYKHSKCATSNISKSVTHHSENLRIKLNDKHIMCASEL